MEKMNDRGRSTILDSKDHIVTSTTKLFYYNINQLDETKNSLNQINS